MPRLGGAEAEMRHASQKNCLRSYLPDPVPRGAPIILGRELGWLMVDRTVERTRVQRRIHRNAFLAYWFFELIHALNPPASFILGAPEICGNSVPRTCVSSEADIPVRESNHSSLSN